MIWPGTSLLFTGEILLFLCQKLEYYGKWQLTFHYQLEDFSVGGYDVNDEVWHAIPNLHNLRSLSFHAVTSFTYQGILNYISTLRPTNAGLQLSVMCASLESALKDKELAIIRDAIAEKVDGKFEFVTYREDDASDFEGDSD